MINWAWNSLIAATFIALITPVVRDVPTVVCVAVSLLCSVWLSFLHWESAVVVSGVLGMSSRVCLQAIGSRAAMIYLMIVAMGLVVFLNRYLFIEPRLPVRLTRGAREFLGFAVPGMLTAIAG